MSNFTFEFNEDMAKAAGQGGGGALPSGVYDFTIETVEETVASTGTVGYNFNFLINGKNHMVYGFWVQKANGDKIFNADILMALMGLNGIKKLTTFQKEIETKNGKKTITAVKEFEGVKGKVALQKVLDWYNGEETEKNEIKQFFDEEGRTFAEKASNAAPRQMEYFRDKLKDKLTDAYKKAQLDNDDASEGDTSGEESGGSIL
jgi:hypothetical protein